MNGTDKGVAARSATARTTIVVRQEIRATSEDVALMIADHYAARGVSISPSRVSIETTEGGGSGFSSSGPAFRGATIRFIGEDAKLAEAEGLRRGRQRGGAPGVRPGDRRPSDADLLGSVGRRRIGLLPIRAGAPLGPASPRQGGLTWPLASSRRTPNGRPS